MKGQLKIEKILAVICTDVDGTEGLPAINVGGMTMPLVAADQARMNQFMSIADDLAKSGRPVKVVEFSTATVVKQWNQN